MVLNSALVKVPSLTWFFSRVGDVTTEDLVGVDTSVPAICTKVPFSRATNAGKVIWLAGTELRTHILDISEPLPVTRSAIARTSEAKQPLKATSSRERLENKVEVYASLIA